MNNENDLDLSTVNIVNELAEELDRLDRGEWVAIEKTGENSYRAHLGDNQSGTVEDLLNKRFETFTLALGRKLCFNRLLKDGSRIEFTIVEGVD